MIIEAARTVIAQRGMAATRMREVASAAGVSLGTLTYHFTGIDELLAEVIRAEERRFLRPIVERALAADSGREGLRTLVAQLFGDDERTREHWLLWLDFWTLAGHDARYGSWQDTTYREWREVVATLVERGRADRSLQVDDPERSVSHFMLLTDGIGSQAYLSGRDTPDATRPDLLLWTLVADLFDFTDDVLAPAGTAPSSQHDH